MKTFAVVVHSALGLVLLFALVMAVMKAPPRLTPPPAEPSPPPLTSEQMAARHVELVVLYRECRLTPISQMTVAMTNKCNDNEWMLRRMDRQQ